MISRWRHCGLLEEYSNRTWARSSTILAISGLLALSSLTMTRFTGYFNADPNVRLSPIIAPLLVLAVAISRPCRWFLSTRVSSLLGRLSFPLYLVQYPVIVSLTCAMVVRYAARETIGVESALLVVLVSLAVCLVAATAFLPIELLTKRVGALIGTRLLRR